MLTAAISEPMSQPSEAKQPAPPPAAGTLAFPASVAQQVFWYMELLQGEVTAFNVPLRFRLDGPLDAALLKRTMDTIVARHESLRTRFGEDQGELLQIVMPELELHIPMIDISHLPPDRLGEETDRLGGIEARRGFRLATGPMIRAELVRLSAESHMFHVTVHHAIFDGMSMTVLTREIAAIYQAYSGGLPCPLDPPALQYGDFSVWQKEFLESPEMAERLAWWKAKLAGMTEPDLPTDFPRPPVKTWKGDIVSTLLPKELMDRLRAISAERGASLFHIQLAAFNILLGRYCGTTDIAVGTPVTGRTREELEPLIGVFINSLILRNDLSGNPGFGEFVETVRDNALEALENQDLPFECLVRELRPERDESRNPLFQVNFNHHRSFAQPGTFGGVTLTPVPSRSPGTIFDLHFFMVERGEGWRASCDYSTDLFTRASAERMLGHFKRLLEDISLHPERPIDQLEILTDAERSQLLGDWAGSGNVYPRDATVGSLFLETANRFPERIALRSGETSLNYAKLHAEASRLALRIWDRVKPGDVVAIAAKPSPETIIAFLAVLLAGGCCAPIDPSYPADRIALLLEECGAEIGLATADSRAGFPAGWADRIVEIPACGAAGDAADLPEIRATAEDPAALLFTSGSTGRPKGVLLAHRGIVRLVRNNGFLPISPDDVFLQAAPMSFDASLLEIWGPLLNGACVVMLPDGPDVAGISRAARERCVTILWLTSGLFQLMVDEDLKSLEGLKYILAGGDVLSVPHVRKAMDALPNTKLINGYGPTENTTFTTCHAITPADLEKPSIPIGKPIANTKAYLLDELLRPVPVGIPGELFTGGDGLAIGYRNAPDLTAEKFVTHPDFGRLYRTGDLCRRAADGTIEFLGRRDHQVKIRGFRIELGEIESCLAAHPAVSQARAAARGETAGTKRILAWATARDGSQLDETELSAWLAERLPGFMRPDAIGVIGAFPLNANGKIDLGALPDPARPVPAQAKRDFAPPAGPVECKLAAIWQDLLGRDAIDRDDDFFELGGHSLMALRMFARIDRDFGKSLPLAALLKRPTIAKLATELAPAAAQAAEETGDFNLVTLAAGGGGPALFCIHGGDGGVIFYRNLARLLPPELPVRAIESRELGGSREIAASSVAETAASYLRGLRAVQPSGPYLLAGYSFGGVVAHEMACQLRAAGETVDFLGLFDTHNPAGKSRDYSLAERMRVFWQQNSDLPFLARLARVRARCHEGMRTNRRIRNELRAASRAGPAEPYSDLRRIQVREENWRAMRTHVPPVFDGQVTLFKSATGSDKVERAADYGWAAHAASGLRIVPVRGAHLTIFEPENVASLAAALAGALPESTRPSSDK